MTNLSEAELREIEKRMGELKPVAWVTYGKVDGSEKFEIGSLSANEKYCATYKEYKWEPLYSAETVRELQRQVAEYRGALDLIRRESTDESSRMEARAALNTETTG